MAKYGSLAFLPWMVKILWGIIIDVHFFEKKRTYLLAFGVISTLSHLLLASGLSDDPLVNLGFLIAMNFG